MRTSIKETEYTRPELNLVSIYEEGIICLSEEIKVNQFTIEGEEIEI